MVEKAAQDSTKRAAKYFLLALSIQAAAERPGT
jgi:hypothetical protein